MNRNIFQDWAKNKRNIKGRLIMVFFRISTFAAKSNFLFVILIPYLIIYRVVIEWILGVELPYKTKIGEGLAIHHGHALVINDGSVIGINCTLRHCTTIGNKQTFDGIYTRSPIIGDNVNIGSNVCIIGPVTIGSNSIIGAGSVIVKDIPENSVVAGNPARIIKRVTDFSSTFNF